MKRHEDIAEPLDSFKHEDIAEPVDDPAPTLGSVAFNDTAGNIALASKGGLGGAVAGLRAVASLPTPRVERSFVGDIGAGALRGLANVPGSIGPALRGVGAATGVESIRATGEGLSRLGDAMRVAAPPSADMGGARKVATGVAEAIPDFMQQIAVGLMARSPKAAVGYAGVSAASRQWSQAKDEFKAMGMDDVEAGKNATGEAVASGLFTAITSIPGMDLILRTNPAVASTIRQKVLAKVLGMVKGGTAEGLQEAGEQIAGEIVSGYSRGTRGGTGDGQTVGDSAGALASTAGEVLTDPAALKEAMHAGLVGFFLGGGASVGVNESGLGVQQEQPVAQPQVAPATEQATETPQEIPVDSSPAPATTMESVAEPVATEAVADEGPLPLEEGESSIINQLAVESVQNRSGVATAIAELDHVPTRDEWAKWFPNVRVTKAERAEFQLAVQAELERQTVDAETNPELEADLRRRGEAIIRTGIDPDTNEQVEPQVMEQWRSWVATKPLSVDQPSIPVERAVGPTDPEVVHEGDAEPDAPPPPEVAIDPAEFDLEPEAEPPVEKIDDPEDPLVADIKRLSAKLNEQHGSGGRSVSLHSGIDPAAFQTAAQLGVKLLQLGYRKLSSFVSAFAKAAGANLAQYANAAYQVARATVGAPVKSKQQFINPKAEVTTLPADLGVFSKALFPTLSNAYRSGSGTVKAAAESMVLGGFEMDADIQQQLDKANPIFKSVPKAMREKFFSLMDEYHDPATIDADPSVPQELKAPLKFFKEQGEWQRTIMRDHKREVAAAVLANKTMAELVAEANARGKSWAVRYVRSPGRPPLKVIVDSNGTQFSKAQAVTAASKLMVPDDWGRKYAHIFHAFLGRFKLYYIDAAGKKIPIGSGVDKASAETEGDAYRQLHEFAKRNPSIPIDKLVAEREMRVPLDVYRIGSNAYRQLVDEIGKAANTSAAEVRDALRGKVGQQKYREKFYAPLMHRSGKEGYSRDFAKVWAAQTIGFNRWRHLGRIRKEVVPLIEGIRGEGRTHWANWLEASLDQMWGDPPSHGEQTIDLMAEAAWRGLGLAKAGLSGPKPFLMSRFLRAVRAVNYWGTLQTGRQALLNTIQPFSVLYPLMGAKNFALGEKAYFSKRGRKILRDHGRTSRRGKFGGDFVTSAVERVGDAVSIAGRTEQVAQDRIFVSAFVYATDVLGKSPAEAARYARLHGNIHAGFSFSSANRAAMFRGPIGQTIFQYRGFGLNMLALGLEQMKARRYGSVARFVAMQMALGGIHAVVPRTLIGLAARATGASFLRHAFDDEDDSTAKMVMNHGLPTLLGMDISGSLSVIDAPMGRTFGEKVSNVVLGPSGTKLVRMFNDMASDQGPEQTTAAGRAARSLVASSPSVKAVIDLLDVLDSDPSDRETPDGRLLWERSLKQAWFNAFGLRTADETRQQEIIDSIADVDAMRNSAVSKAAQAFNSSDADTVEETVQDWNASFPAFAITMKDVRERAKSRREGAQKDRMQRAVESLPKRARAAVVQ